MTMKNTWYLITSEELGRMRNRLQAVGRVVPDDHQDHIAELSEIINSVEHRLA